jgi:hypothetical protein
VERRYIGRCRLPKRRAMARPTRRRLGLACVLAALAVACNLIDTRLGRHAELSAMLPGAVDEAGALECWLTLEFKSYPPDGNLRDVRVRFESIALAEPAEFDWEYIASHDKLSSREGFDADDLHEAEITSVVSRPPLGHPTQVRFPLRAKLVIEDAPATLFLEAELYWGGERQHVLRQTIEHIYSDEPPDPL